MVSIGGDLDHALGMPRRAATISLLPRQRSVLERLVRSPSVENRLVSRAQIVLVAVDFDVCLEQAEAMGVEEQRVRRWRARFVEAADMLNAAELQPVTDVELEALIVDVLRDDYRAGGGSKFSAAQVAQIIALACQQPKELGLPFTHWTPKELAREAKKRKIVDDISPRHIARFFGGGRDTAAPFPVLAEPEDHGSRAAQSRGRSGLRRLRGGDEAHR